LFLLYALIKYFPGTTKLGGAQKMLGVIASECPCVAARLYALSRQFLTATDLNSSQTDSH